MLKLLLIQCLLLFPLFVEVFDPYCIMQYIVSFLVL